MNLLTLKIQRADEETPHVSKIKPPERSPKGQPIPRREGALHTLLFSRKAAAPAVLFAIAFALYANTFNHDFVVDDNLVVTENAFVQKGIAGLVDIFSNGYLSGYDRTAGGYRPLTLATFACEVSLAGINPHVHHATNVVLYCFLAVALFVLLRTILKNYNPLVPFIITLLFVVHPIHTEVVANIKSRDEILSFLFAVCSLLLFLRGVSTNTFWPRLLSYFSYFLALLSKEHVIMFLFIVPLVMHFFTKINWGRVIRESLPFVVVALAYLIIRWSILGVDTINQAPPLLSNSLVATPGIFSRTPMALSILGRYLLLLFLPLHLSWDYSYNQIPFVSWDDLGAIVSMAVYAAMAFYSIYGFVHRNERSFGIAYYLITLAVVSNIFFLLPTTMAERLLFTPSLGFCYTIGVSVARFGRWEFRSSSSPWMGWTVPALIMICIVLGVRTISRAADWKDNLTLFTTDVMTSPNSARVYTALGVTYVELGKKFQKGDQRTELFQKAVFNLRKSLAILPGQWDSWHDLGLVHFLAGDYNEALIDYRSALQFDPNNAKAHTALGATYLELGKKFQKGDQQTGLFQKAIVEYRKSLEIQPAQGPAWHDLGNAYYFAGDYDEAFKAYKRALEYNPTRSRTHLNMGIIAFSRNEYGRAIEFFKSAVKLDSSDADACGNLGVAYQQIGEHKNATAQYERALQLDPRLEQIRRNLDLLSNTSVTKK